MAENKKSFVAYADWESIFDLLNDEQAGKLIKHILAYVNDKNPETEDLLIKLAFEPIKMQLKRDLRKYEDIKENRRIAGKIGANKRWQNIANNSKRISDIAKIADNDNVNDNDNENVNDNESPNGDTRKGDIFSNHNFSPFMQSKIKEWLQYKAERREAYKDTGRTTLLSEIQNRIKVHGEQNVADLMDSCMANNWRGIIWDKIKASDSIHDPPEGMTRSIVTGKLIQLH